MSVSFPQDFSTAALLGKVEGVSALVIAGRSTTIQTVEPPITVGFGNALQPYAAANESWEIVSSSVNDTAAGTGARTVLISYLDDTYVQRSALVILNGTTAVPIAANCFRAQTAVVVAAGSGTVNAGQLTIRVAGGGASRALVVAGKSSSRQGSFTIPAGFVGIIHSTAFVVGRPTGPGVIATIEAHLIDSLGVHRIGLDFTVNEPGIPFAFSYGVAIPEKNTLDYRVSAVSANGVDVSVLSTGLLVNSAVLKWPLT